MHALSAFDESFYRKYHSIRPKSSPHYDERMMLYELYHHLNHYLMFGVSAEDGSGDMGAGPVVPGSSLTASLDNKQGSYASGATRLMQRLLKEYP